MQWFVEWLKDMTIGMDWHQFIPSLIATFVGIFMPFRLQRRHDKKQRRKDAERLIKQIVEELETLRKDMQEREQKATEKNASLFIDPLLTPIGDSLLNSNGMSILTDLQNYLNKKYKRSIKQNKLIANTEWVKTISEVYARISNYNILQNKYAEQTIYMLNNFAIIEGNQKSKEEDQDRESKILIQANKIKATIKEKKQTIAKAIIKKIGEEETDKSKPIDSLLPVLHQILILIKDKKRGLINARNK